MRMLFAVAVAMTGLSNLCVGQTRAEPHVGDRIRVHQVGGTDVIGDLESLSATALVLGGTSQESRTIGLDRVERLDRSLGVRRRFLRNMALTIGVAAAAGGVLSAATWTPCTETGFLACFLYPESRSEAFSWGVAGGGLVGIPIGVIVGLSVRREQWEPLEGFSVGAVTLRLVPPSPTGVAVVVSIPAP